MAEEGNEHVEEPAAGAGPGTRTVCPSCNGTYDADASVCPNDGTGLLEIPDTPLLTGATLDGRYEIGGVVGAGGMGIVYRAHQRAMERDVAVKVLHPHYAHDPRAVKRFFREAQASSRLIHENVVTVYDFGRSGEGHLYMVMELLDGWTLGDLIFHRAPLSPRTAVGLAVQVSDALQAAHRRRIVHRDLKPDNVQLVSRDGAIVAKVLDFGIARVMRDPDAGLGMHLSTVDIAGTPAYMSPEQIMGKDPDPRSDTYSLGVILYEMLTGERPFADEHSVTLCMKQLNERPPAMADRVGEGRIPEVLEALVQQMLTKDVAERPPNAREVRDLLVGTGLAPTRLIDTLGAEDTSGVGGSMPTRPDAGAMMMLPTLEGPEAAAMASLGDVIKRVRSAAPGEGGDPSLPCGTCGAADVPVGATCPRCGQAQELRRPGRSAPAEEAPPATPKAGAEPVAVAMLLVAREADLDVGPVADWLEAQRRAGFRVVLREATASVQVPPAAGLAPKDACRRLLEHLQTVRTAALRGNLALRMGVADASAAAPSDLGDLARRLAVAAPHGDVAMPAPLAHDLGVRGRPITSVSLPSGRSLPCFAAAGAAPGAERWVPDLYLGRNRELRRLGSLADEARRRGPTTVVVTGDRGVGRTTLLRAFAGGRAHLFMRTAPVARAWPGHTAERLVRRCLDLADDAADAAVRERIDPLPLPLRDHLAVLLLDSRDVHGVTTAALARALAEVLAWRAGEGGFCLLLDDAHLVDGASREILARLPEQAQGRPWLLVATAPRRALDRAPLLWSDGERVDLRPLGLRAAGAILRGYEVPGHRRAEVMDTAAGNPLALTLLASGQPGPMPARRDALVPRLLPEHIRGIPPREAEAAWLAAVHGDEETADDMAIRAARLYLEHGAPRNVARWMAERLEESGGLCRRLLPAFRSGVLSAAARIERTERLGLWRLGAREAERAAGAVKGAATASLLLTAARLRARAGDVDGAVSCFDGALAIPGRAPDVAELVQLGSVLLDMGEIGRGEQVLLQARERLSDHVGAAVLGQLAALLARCAIRRNDVAEAMAHLGCARETLALLRPVDARAARGIEALTQEIRAEVALAEGDASGTRTNLRQARDAFRDLGRPADAIRCLVDLGRVELDDQEPSRAADTLRAAVGLAGAAGLDGELRRARTGLGEALVALGETERGAGVIRRVLREVEGDAQAVTAAAVGMARAMLALDLREDALRYAERALVEGASTVTRCRALFALGEAKLRSAQTRVAARAFQEAERLAHAAGHGLLEAAVHERLTDLELVHGLDLGMREAG
ncbi:MAG: protein kinase domain-containing protein [Myxococcota bacterium]